MRPEHSFLQTLDAIARAQLALLHAAVLRPGIDWDLIQQLVMLWQASNAERYRRAGLDQHDTEATLRMVFRDYVQQVRSEDPEEAEQLVCSLGPELQTF